VTIDELIVKIVLDASGFLSGQKATTDAADALKAKTVAAANAAEKGQSAAAEKARKAAEAEAKKIQEANAKTSESVIALGRRVLGLYALFTAGRGVKEFVSDITSADAALGRVAKNVDLSGKALSTWQGAATVAGGSAEGVTGSISKLSSEMQNAALTGQSSIIPVFRALGINLADTSGKARSATDVLLDFNRKTQGMDPARISALGHMAGFDDGTINLLEMSTDKLQALLKEQEKYAANAADIESAQKRQTGWRELLNISTSLGRTILTELTPAITGVMHAVLDWANANQEWLKHEIVTRVGEFIGWLRSLDWTKIGDDFRTFATNVGALAAAFAGVVAAVSGQSPLAVAFEAFGALLALRILAPLRAIVTTIGLLGSTALPGWIAKFLGIAVPVVAPVAAAVVATTSPLNAGEPTVGPDWRLTYPDGHSEAGRTWDGHTGHGAQVRDRAHHDQVDNRNLWQRSAPKWAGGKDAPAGDVQVPTDAHTPLKDLISKHETGTTGAGGYETVYGHVERGGPLAPSKPITEMSIAEVLAYQHEMKPKAGSPAFPVGRAQWVEKTLRGLTAKMDQNTKFTPEVQEKLFDRSIRPRLGQGPAGMRAEWDSMRSVSDGEIQSAIDGHRKAVAFMKDTPKSEAQQVGPKGADAPQAPQSATGQKGVYPEWMDERSRREMAGVNAPLARDLLAASEATGQRFKVAQGMRTPEEAAGNAASGRGVRNSQHLYGAAADIHILDDKGNVTYDRAAYQKFADAYEDHSRKSGGNSRWLGNAGGRWASDIVHFDQGLGYGQSRARDPYGEGGPTKADVTASRQDAYKSPDNPFARAARAVNPISPAEAKEAPYHPPIQDDRSTRARGTPSPFPGDAGQDYRARGGPQYGVPHVETAGDTHRPEVTSTLGGTRMLPAGRMLTFDVPKPAPVPSAAAGYGREHNAGRPQVPNMSGSSPMLPAGRMLTFDDAANHVLKTMKGANDNRPIKVDLTDGSATKIGVAGKSGIDMLMARHSGALRSHVGAELKKSGAEMDRAFGKAWTGLGHHAGIGAGERAWAAVNHAHHQTTTHHVDNSSETHVGEMHVHPQTGDGKQFARDFRDGARQRSSVVTQANAGLA